MSRKTEPLYVKSFEMLKVLVPQFTPTSTMADFEESPVSAFPRVFGNVSFSNCWFHNSQSIIKRLQKSGLKDCYVSNSVFTPPTRTRQGCLVLSFPTGIASFNTTGEAIPRMLQPNASDRYRHSKQDSGQRDNVTT